ncbi:MAG TPA: HipA family kinase [Candidatus Limnocylindrales bacterium]|nr:HipA family kinase [Candidatus Limnocylindrales bacterium]
MNQSHIVECDDGLSYIVKPHGNDRQFANELIGLAIGELLSIPMPDGGLITITEDFRTAASGMAPRYAAGVHFGSLQEGRPHFTFVNPEPDLVQSEVANASKLYDLVVYDELVANGDRKHNAGNTLLVRVKDSSPKFEFRAIDNGHILTGPGWTAQTLAAHPLAPLVPVYKWFESCMTSLSMLSTAAATADSVKSQFDETVDRSRAQLSESDKVAVREFLLRRASQLPSWVCGPQYAAELTAMK